MCIVGESILIAQPHIAQYSATSLVKWITKPIPPVTTCLVKEKREMQRAMLEVGIGMEMVSLELKNVQEPLEWLLIGGIRDSALASG